MRVPKGGWKPPKPSWFLPFPSFFKEEALRKGPKVGPLEVERILELMEFVDEV